MNNSDMSRQTQEVLKRFPVIMMRSGKKRNSDGNVPNVNWNGNYDKLHVNWYNADNRKDNIRSREEVSTKNCRSLSGS